MERNLVKSQHIIEFEADFPVKMGQVFYTVERLKGQYFYGKCEICDGSKEINYKGYTFKCPKCFGIESNNPCVLQVGCYIVYRYRVQEIAEQITMNDWNPSKGFHHSIRVVLERPSPRGTNEYSKFVKGHYNSYRCLSLERKVYCDYKEAVAEADRLNAEQEAIVTKYNNDYGTNFVFEKPKYDLKSK